MGNETFYSDGLKENKTNCFPRDLTLGTTTAVKTTVKKKGNLRSFKLNRVYLDPLNMSNSNDFPGVEFLRILFRLKKIKGNSS